MLWEPISLFNEISVTCKYKREGWDYIRSERSNPKKILVVGWAWLPKLSCLWIVVIVTFGVCGARVVSSDKPWINVNSSDIMEGDWVKVLCGVPIDYTGGFCRLYRDETKIPLKTLQTNSYTCEFLVSAHELLAGRRAGTRTTVRCDYKLQNYVSVSSDNKVVVVWGTAEKPVLTMSPQVLMLDSRVHVNCEAPQHKASQCTGYRDTIQVDWIPCNHQMKAEKLMEWASISLFNEISVSCDYQREGWDYIQSEKSDPKKILVVDPARLQISKDHTNGTFICEVPARVQDFVILHTGSKTLSLEMGGKLTLEAINNSTGPFNQTCRSV
ncbi:hypothetical protein SKAU_G00070990 [Synaphobranchus kaupii]|uniref:Ig-like domain-containing protein n=1 Tax=Synaphobranchus kaupii TaxID=118154 RepID=A0A9Q1G6Q6_SYNKA|nr:hypothetical protein SKAU_G00070990 [Synaphobranchus kaupii]